jgi:5-methylcytosine-specific restriction endonuclease McrA
MEPPQRTLVLSMSYEPVSIVSWKQAVTLLYSDKVEVVEEYDQPLRSPSTTIMIPAVVRLKKPFKRFRKPLKFSRSNVYARDQYRCQYCGQRFPVSELTYDHVIPRSQGGKTVWTNIATACEHDNRKKAGQTPAQAGMRLLSEPHQPKGFHTISHEVNRDLVPASWLEYLV